MAKRSVADGELPLFPSAAEVVDHADEDDPIAPDVETGTPLEDAVNWIIMNY